MKRGKKEKRKTAIFGKALSTAKHRFKFHRILESASLDKLDLALL